MTTPLVAGLTSEEFERVWSMGVSSDRQLGRPKEWDGKEITFDDFILKFSNWLSGLPGEGDTLLEHAARHASVISIATMSWSR